MVMVLQNFQDILYVGLGKFYEQIFFYGLQK